jgi:hypothetical protein
VDPRNETEGLLVPQEVRQHPAWVRLNDQLGWYDNKSAVNQKRYKQIQAAQIILATSIPVFSLIDAVSGRWITAILGASVAILAAFSNSATTTIYGRPTALPQSSLSTKSSYS